MTIQRSWPKSSLGGGNASTPNWSQFMVDYAVFPSNTGASLGTHSATWRIRSQYGANKTVGLAVGTYTLECQSDNNSTFTWKTAGQSTYLGALSVSGSHNTSTNFTINITDADSEQYLLATITNVSSPPDTWSNNPAGVAWELKNSGGTVIRRSTDSFDKHLKYSEIAAEFGYPSGNKFGNYRNTTTVSGWNLGSLPLDTGIPTSGTIRFSDFFEKQLNVVVDCYDDCPDYHVNARDEWDNNNVVVVGDTNGSKRNDFSKVIIHVNKEIGGPVGGYGSNAAAKEIQRGKCALRTGTGWNLNSKMVIDIGPSGKLRGAGGNGGNGNVPSSSNVPETVHGKEGNSGLGIQHGSNTNKTVINIDSSSILRAGYGGGGGGGGSYFDEKGGGGHPFPGTGGGGGAGWPVGAAGPAGTGHFGDGAAANPGTAGTKTTGGAKGSGTNTTLNKQGGDGGELGTAAQAGTNGQCDAGCSSGGSAGGDGNALRSTGASNTYNLNNNGSMVGGTKNSTDVG